MAGGLRILVVEDDASVRRSVGRLLRASGFECVEHDSAEALLQSEDPMPGTALSPIFTCQGLCGFELLESLREVTPTCRQCL